MRLEVISWVSWVGMSWIWVWFRIKGDFEIYEGWSLGACLFLDESLVFGVFRVVFVFFLVMGRYCCGCFRDIR